MNSAVHDLQVAIVEGKKSVAQLLRQTKLIAAKLNLKDVEAWVDLELHGYPSAQESPDYREVKTEKLILHNQYRGGWEYVGDVTRKHKAHQSIAEIEMLAQEAEVSVTPEKKFHIVDSMGSCESSQWPQRLTIVRGQFGVILEAVRNELLRWAIELEKRGIIGENMNFDEKEKESAAKHEFHIGTVHGAVGNITNSQVTVYDYSSVQKLLIDHNVPKQVKRELEDIMDEIKDAPPDKKPSLISGAQNWLVKHKEVLGAAFEVVGKFIGSLGGKHS